MRLDFNVLWVEDQQDRVQAQKEKMEFVIRKEGFRLQVQFASSVEEAIKYLADDDVYGDHIDLILMDYDLGAGQKGDEGLIEVRNRFLYKDIVFYSSRANDLPDLVAAKKVQGVFCSTRDDLPDTVEGVFESLVKKVLDIDHARGIVMGATSDIDQYINESLVAVFDGCEHSQRSQALAAVTERVTEKRAAFDKQANKITQIEHLRDLQLHHNIYTADDRLRLLNKLLKLLGIHSDKLEKLVSYRETVMPKRNDLAHVRVEKTGGFSRKLYDRNDQELTVESMRSLRIALLDSQDVFEALALDLTRQDEPSSK